MAELYTNLVEATVTYATPIYTSFDALAGAVAGEATTFAKTVVYGDETNYADVAGTKTLFADYLFGTEYGVISFDLDVKDNSANTIPTINFNTDIPVQRNYLTTIQGPVLTDANNVTVTIEKEFDGVIGGVENVNTTESFIAALADAEECVEAVIDLTSDVVWVTGAGIGSTPFISETAKTQVLTINGNGNTITATGQGVGAIRMANGGKLVFNNVVIVDESVSYAENSWEYGYLEFAGNLEFNNCQFVNAIMVEDGNATFNNCQFNSNDANQYDVWVSGNKAYFNECLVEGYRGIKMHEAYGSEVEEVVIDNCHFNKLSKKPGVAMGDLNADTKVVIKNSTFTNCQAGDQGLYIYETDTDVTTFDFTEENNTIVCATESSEGFNAALAAGEQNIALAAGEYDLPSAINSGYSANEVVTIVGAGIDNTTVNGARNSNANSPGNYANGLDLVFENLTFETANNGYNGGFGHAKSVTFRNCKIVGQYYAHSGAPHFFYNCTIDPLNDYLYTYASDCVFEDCTFAASKGKALQIYEDSATGENTVTITNCSFVAAEQAATWDGKPVTGIDVNSNGAKFVVYINNCTTVGFPAGLNSKSDLWNIKDGGKAHATIYVDDAKVWEAGYEYLAAGILVKDGEYLILNKAGLFSFANQVNVERNAFNGQTVKLTADIDLNNEAWTPVGQTGATTFNGVFDGQNFTIYNLNVNSIAQTGAYYSSGLFGWVETHAAGKGIIKNVKIDGATIKGNHNCGALVGYITETNALVENCHVANAAIECHYANGDADGDKAGALIGNATNATKVSGCTATDCTVSAGRDAGQLIGAGKVANVTDCSATNVTVTANGEGTGANIANDVVGRKL